MKVEDLLAVSSKGIEMGSKSSVCAAFIFRCAGHNHNRGNRGESVGAAGACPCVDRNSAVPNAVCYSTKCASNAENRDSYTGSGPSFASLCAAGSAWLRFANPAICRDYSSSRHDSRGFSDDFRDCRNSGFQHSEGSDKNDRGSRSILRRF